MAILKLVATSFALVLAVSIMQQNATGKKFFSTNTPEDSCQMGIRFSR